jgi:hypothetical protein
MAKYLPKAERMFQQKLKNHLGPQWGIHDFTNGCDMSAIPGDLIGGDELKMFYRDFSSAHFDFNYIAELFRQYGAYLQLIEEESSRDVSAETDSGTTSGTEEGLQRWVHSAGTDRDLPGQQEDDLSEAERAASNAIAENEATIEALKKVSSVPKTVRD